MTIPRSVVLRALGRLSDTAMAAIDDGLRDALEL